ncbi:tRNA pseudouridine38-40 synthase [Lachnospiraceae bacterium RM5]|nr:tRNA pseudouridine38-40 synthase [Lachnospiraceae bacterium RM5]
MEKRRVKLIIAYDGTNYVGWQKQINGIAVEEILNKELTRLLGEEIEVIGASRTDSGVHALGNVAVFDTVSKIPPEKMSFALNQRLPNDIRIQESKEVSLDFHPRYQDTIKTYEYKILNRRFDIPTMRLYHYFMYMPLDENKMAEAAKYLVGEHDFKSFCSARSQVKDTIRTVTDLSVTKSGDVITIRISGNGFLYNMVRIIAGTLIKVGLNVYPPEHVKEILEAKDRNVAGPKAPARGLTLIDINYLSENSSNII